MRILSLISVIVILLSFFVLPASAQVANGAISEAALSYFEGVVTKLPSGQDYFLYRSGDYTTVLITSSDLELVNNVVRGTKVTLYQYDQRGGSAGSGYNTYYPEYTVSEFDVFEVNTNTFSIAYSSLGDWSELTSRDQSEANSWIQYILWSVVILILLFIAFKLIRNRRSYINL